MRTPHLFPSTIGLFAALAIAMTQGCASSSGDHNADSAAGTTLTQPDTSMEVVSAAPSTLSAPITDVEWSLVELNGQPAGMGAGSKPATLTLASKDNRASGFAGCNRMGGTYTLTGNELRFGPMMMTRMACDQGMDLETRYSAITERVRSYQAMDKQLELMSGDTVLARFTKP